MSEPPEPQAEEARRWLRWAREDLILAEHIAKDPEVVRRGVCTWAHQAAEKALKALLVARSMDPPKVHDLVRLSRLLDDEDQVPFGDLDLTELTRWAIEGRYPGDVQEATATDAKVALDTARATVDVAAALLGSAN
jgi:HEPN domain-containing protein